MLLLPSHCLDVLGRSPGQRASSGRGCDSCYILYLCGAVLQTWRVSSQVFTMPHGNWEDIVDCGWIGTHSTFEKLDVRIAPMQGSPNILHGGRHFGQIVLLLCYEHFLSLTVYRFLLFLFKGCLLYYSLLIHKIHSV